MPGREAYRQIRRNIQPARSDVITKERGTSLKVAKVADVVSERLSQSETHRDLQESSSTKRSIELDSSAVILNDNAAPDHSVSDPVAPLAERTPFALKQENFEEKLLEQAVIFAPAEAVRLLLTRIDQWPHRIPHVLDIKVNYDDGFYQEFTTNLDSGTGSSFTVRSVRRCHVDRIAFFNPEPAGFLSHHCGEWIIRSLARNITHLTALQCWTRSAKSEDRMTARGGLSSKSRVSELLRRHARAEMAMLKNNLEQEATTSTLSLVSALLQSA